VTLTLADARRVIAAGERRAHELGQPMNIAVVDDGGNLVSHVRMDGAWRGSIDVSLNKAFTTRALVASRQRSARAYDLATAVAYGEAGHHGNGHHADRDLPAAPSDDYRGAQLIDDPSKAHPFFGLSRGGGLGQSPQVPLPPGGLALLRTGLLVGAIGVSGGTPAQDQAVAEAAASAL
jgi:uncharacterized protein GlcG (DUF336 family)